MFIAWKSQSGEYLSVPARKLARGFHAGPRMIGESGGPDIAERIVACTAAAVANGFAIWADGGNRRRLELCLEPDT